jgi:hypothetical protein
MARSHCIHTIGVSFDLPALRKGSSSTVAREVAGGTLARTMTRNMLIQSAASEQTRMMHQGSEE